MTRCQKIAWYSVLVSNGLMIALIGAFWLISARMGDPMADSLIGGSVVAFFCLAAIGMGYRGFVKGKTLFAGIVAFGFMATTVKAVVLALVGSAMALCYFKPLTIYLIDAALFCLLGFLNFVFTRGFIQVRKKRKLLRAGI